VVSYPSRATRPELSKWPDATKKSASCLYVSEIRTEELSRVGKQAGRSVESSEGGGSRAGAGEWV
jgi:hypothetical protein